MVSVREFENAQRILDGGSWTKPEKYDFPFTGAIRCGECGCMVTAEQHTKKSGRRYVYYHCTKKKGRCTEKYVRAEELEAQLRDFIGSLTVPQECVDWLWTKMQEEKDVAKMTRQAELEAIDDQKRELDKKVRVLTQMRLSEEIDREMYREEYNELIQQRVHLEQARHSVAMGNASERFEPLHTAAQLLNLAKNAFENGNSTQKRQLLKIVGLNPTLNDRKLLISAKKPFQQLVERSSFPFWSGKQDELRTLWNTLECSFEELDLGSIKRFVADVEESQGTGKTVPSYSVS